MNTWRSLKANMIGQRRLNFKQFLKHLKHEEFLKIIHKQNQSYILQKVLVNYFNNILREASKKEMYQVYYHIGGIYNFIICWIENDMKDQPESLAKIGAEITSNIEPYLIK